MMLLASADRAARIVLFVCEFEIILLKKMVVEWLTRRLMESENHGVRFAALPSVRRVFRAV
jgi:hypothetical protein